MEQKSINKVNRAVYQQYPALSNVKPKISKQNSSKNQFTYLLLYKKSVEVNSGKKIPVVVRVVCDERGSILKISSSK